MILFQINPPSIESDTAQAASLLRFPEPPRWRGTRIASAQFCSPDAQRAMSKRAGSTIVEVKPSHAVYVSQPQAVAHLIEKAATGALAAGKEKAAAGALAAR